MYPRYPEQGSMVEDLLYQADVRAEVRLPLVEPLLGLASNALLAVDAAGPRDGGYVPHPVEGDFDVAATKKHILREDGLEPDLNFGGGGPGNRVQPFLGLVAVDGRVYVGRQGHVRGEGRPS